MLRMPSRDFTSFSSGSPSPRAFAVRASALREVLLGIAVRTVSTLAAAPHAEATLDRTARRAGPESREKRRCDGIVRESCSSATCDGQRRKRCSAAREPRRGRKVTVTHDVHAARGGFRSEAHR